jgi:hypothetical protein
LTIPNTLSLGTKLLHMNLWGNRLHPDHRQGQDCAYLVTFSPAPSTWWACNACHSNKLFLALIQKTQFCKAHCPCTHTHTHTRHNINTHILLKRSRIKSS